MIPREFAKYLLDQVLYDWTCNACWSAAIALTWEDGQAFGACATHADLARGRGAYVLRSDLTDKEAATAWREMCQRRVDQAFIHAEEAKDELRLVLLAEEAAFG